MKENKIVIIDNDKEVEMNIYLTFESNDKKYVVVYDPKDEDTLIPFSYDDKGNLYAVEDEEEMSMIEEVVGAFGKEKENEEK